MKQAHVLKTFVLILAVSGCSPPDSPPVTPKGATSGAASQPAGQGESTSPPGTTGPAGATSPGGAAGPGVSRATGAETPAVPKGESLEGKLPAEELEALRASARALVEQFVGALSNHDASAAQVQLVSKEAFDQIVAPGFRSILGSSLLAKNQQEVANLVEALTGHKVTSWEWKPGKLVKTQPESAFSRELVQITGSTIELNVDGTFIALGLDQLVRLEDGWVIFQLHNL